MPTMEISDPVPPVGPDTDNRLTVAGLGFLALSMTVAILLVTDVVFDSATAGVCTALVGGLFAVLWFASPLHRRLAHKRARSGD